MSYLNGGCGRIGIASLRDSAYILVTHQSNKRRCIMYILAEEFARLQNLKEDYKFHGSTVYPVIFVKENVYFC